MNRFQRLKIVLFAKMTLLAIALCMLVPISFEAADAGSPSLQTTKWSVRGRQIMVDGEPFFVKGVAYCPTPVGGSFNWPPFGDWFSREWHRIYERDLPRIREMGANSIRVYSWFALDPTNENYRRAAELSFSGESVRDHSDFLDKAWNNGLKSIYVLIDIPLDRPRVFYSGDDKEREADSRNVYRFYKRLTRWAAEKYGKHPAVMGFSIGNECNMVESDPSHSLFWERIGELARITKTAAADKLVTTCWYHHSDDHFCRYPEMIRDSNFDLLCVNLYEGGNKYTEFWDMLNEQTAHSAAVKPFIAGEFGTPASERDAEGAAVEMADHGAKQADWLASQWNNIVQHSVLRDPVNGIASGGFLFSWSDEWWKTDERGGHAAIQDGSNEPAACCAGGWLDQEWFGINSIRPAPGRPEWRPYTRLENPEALPPDILTPRKAYYLFKDLWR